MDVTSTDEVNQIVESAVMKFGAPHAVVANAGIALREPFSAMTDQRWRRTLDADLKPRTGAELVARRDRPLRG